MKMLLRRTSLLLVLIACFFIASPETAFAVDVNGRIKGTVTDPSGAVLANITVIATNQDTGVKFTTVSSSDGNYVFNQLPIGTYSISASGTGFKGFSATGIKLNIDQEYVEPVRLEIGSASDTVSVQADAVQVNLTDIQLNNIVDSHQITELPLIGRAFTQLELILPGVQSSSDRFGLFSVNGSQTQQSSYLINGADSNDLPLNSVALSPNIDALQQFNLVTGPLNAEYDRNSGAVVSTAIKQGTNQFHGDVFEFYRDTFLNTANFFQINRTTGQKLVPLFHQNIFGGTLGGPILRDKLFFFGAYQGTRQVTPESGGNVNVFSSAQRAGNFSGTTFSKNVIPATINIPGCTSGVQTFASCFGPSGLNGQLPTSAFNPISANFLQSSVPLANSGSNGYTFTPVIPLTSNQYIGRGDYSLNSKNQFYFLGIYQKNAQTETLPFTGATVPGFGDKSSTIIQQFSTGYVRQLSSTAINDLEVHYTRFNFDTVEPQHVVQPSSLGFSISPQNQAAASVPTMAVAGLFTLGFSTNGPQPRIDQVYQLDDNFSKSMGHHSFKFGYDGRRFNVHNPFSARNNGSYSFSTTSNIDTTGSAGLDFLLGIPASYSQGSGSVIEAYAFLNYLYAQDTWKVTEKLTLSYGLGYQIDTPLHNLQHGGIGVTCYIPGQQSKVFPQAPKGVNYPGDPSCNNASGAVTHYNGFGPRFGFVYAPSLGVLSGGDTRKLSLSGGYGIYYNRTEEESSLQNLNDPPFGLNSSGAVDGTATNPGFANPYQNLNVAGPAGLSPNKFPFIPPVAGSNPSFSRYLPLSLSQAAPGFRSPYSQNFQLTLEREFPAQTVATISYVGTVGRHNQITIEGNPTTQAGHDACLADPACINISNQQSRNYPLHTQYGFPDPNFNNFNDVTSAGMIATEGASNYHAFQASVKKGLTNGLELQASYTFAHSLDNGSSFEGSGFGGTNGRGYNQYYTPLNYGNSTFDGRHRFVIAPVYMVPFRHGGNTFSPVNLLLSGWQISGIVTFATGLPFDISYAGASSRSLWCSSSQYFYSCPDAPQQIAPLVTANPRVVSSFGNRTTWFQGASFIPEPIGSFGNVSRNRYHGPGINNTNLVLAKNFALSGDGVRVLQIGMESDNVFNHTQFSNPNGSISAVTFDANNVISNPAVNTFGQITAAANARQTLLRAKIYF
jgi:Carboxypeptidase regulatory-like domain